MDEILHAVNSRLEIKMPKQIDSTQVENTRAEDDDDESTEYFAIGDWSRNFAAKTKHVTPIEDYKCLSTIRKSTSSSSSHWYAEYLA